MRHLLSLVPEILKEPKSAYIQMCDVLVFWLRVKGAYSYQPSLTFKVIDINNTSTFVTIISRPIIIARLR